MRTGACQVLFLFFISPLIAVVSLPEIVIGWARMTIAGGKRFPSVSIAWEGSLPKRHVGSRVAFSRRKTHGPHNEGSGQTRRSLAATVSARLNKTHYNLCRDREARFRSSSGK